MLSSTTRVETDHASKYLQQLCKHFGHKVAVDFDATAGKVAFPYGPCSLQAEGRELVIDCHAETEEALAMMQSVVDTHLMKFAWREEIVLSWDTTDVSGQAGDQGAIS